MSIDPAGTTAIVPLRTGGKTRLRRLLCPSERAALAGAMLADVTTALTAARIVRVIVAAEGPAAVTAADALGLEVVHDVPDGGGLDRALARAAARTTRDAALLVVAADLPRLTGDEVARVLEDPTPVVIAPTDDGGTGGLLRRPADLMRTAYGPGSARRHIRLAREAGVDASVVRTPGFGHDVDTVADLVALRGAGVGDATASVLATLDLGGRAAS